MKNPTIVFTLLLFSASNLIFAQEVAKLPLTKLSDIYIQSNMYTDISAQHSFNDFKKMEPNSSTLSKDFSEYNYSNQNIAINSTIMFSILAGFKMRESDKTSWKKNMQMRIGINYLPYAGFDGKMSKKNTYIIDTLVSKKNGNEYYIDSVNYDNYRFRYNNDQLRIHVSYIYSSNPDLKWSIYGGFGINAGGSLVNNLEIVHSNYTKFNSTNNNTSYLAGIEEYENNEIIKCKRNFGGSVFLPFGIDYRLANSNQFFSKIHLFYEISPGLNFNYIPELEKFSNTINAQIGTQLFGLRVSI
jgi:hypothetical protein